MRRMIHEFVAICAKLLPFADPIHEFGAFQVPGQELIAELRPLFAGHQYIGSDMRIGQGVDMLLNLHNLGLPDQSIGSALLLDTLEHVEYPHRAMQEVHRVLQPNGLTIISSVMQFPIHSFPDDYWRYTPSAFQSILKPFEWSLVSSAGAEDFPHTVVGIGSKQPLPANTISRLETELAIWSKRWLYQTHQPTAFELAAKRVAPPFLLDLYRRMRSGG